MVERINREWEITKEYIDAVASRKDLISLDWSDFVKMAVKHNPVSLLTISDERPLNEIVDKGLEILFNDSDIHIEGLILAMEIPKNGKISVADLDEIGVSISERSGDNVEVMWGFKRNDSETDTGCSVKFFVFGDGKQE